MSQSHLKDGAASEREELIRNIGIQAVLNRIQGEGADECECGEPIPKARRLAMPSTNKCIDCQTIEEMKR